LSFIRLFTSCARKICSFWSDISVAIGSATSVNLPRVVIIEDMMRAIENLVAICDQMGEDLSPLRDLMP
jgi:hypothetical protein